MGGIIGHHGANPRLRNASEALFYLLARSRKRRSIRSIRKFAGSTTCPSAETYPFAFVRTLTS
jgi:hypothetical protein